MVDVSYVRRRIQMRAGRPIPTLILSREERETLERWARRPKTAQALAQRARIILFCATGKTNGAVAEKMHLGAPRTLTDAKIERVITLTLESTPRQATHWSIRSMAKHCGLSRMSVQRIWRAFALQPHRTETFKLSSDPLFIEKVRDIVGLYLNPPDRALVLCVDEKTQIQALDRTQPLLPMRPGQAERRTSSYTRHGTTSLFAALDAKSGTIISQLHRRHRAVEFRAFLDAIDQEVPDHLHVHLFLDNYGTHKTALIHRWLTKRPRFHLHFTPTSGSWLNLVERWFAMLTDQQIKRGAHRSTIALEKAIKDYVLFTNENPKPFIWTKTADDILASVARFCQRTSGTGH